jgi:hypothetical protein
MPTISRAYLISGLEERSRRGAIIATIEALTDARLKRGNTLGQVLKRAVVNVMLNWAYERAVNRQREREAGASNDEACASTIETFRAHPRKWGRRVPRTPFVRHREKLYVECKIQRVVSTAYELLDGTAVPEASVLPFLPARSASRQGVDREIVLRDYGIDSIVALTVDGERYLVRE